MREEKRKVRSLPCYSYLTKRKTPSILYLLIILGVLGAPFSAYANNASKFTLYMIAAVEDIDITHHPVIGVGDHGTNVTTSSFAVWNTKGCCNPDPSDGPSEVDLDNLQIVCTDLSGPEHHLHYYIAADDVSFVPDVINYLSWGDSAFIVANVHIPSGMHSGQYKGTITVVDDDGYPSDTASLIITVLPSYDLDIDDNGANLKDNTMNLSGKLGSAVEASFKLINPNSVLTNVDPDPFGNTRLTSLNYKCTDLIYGTHVIPSNSITFPDAPDTLESGVSANVTIKVTIPANQQKGLYTGTVTVVDTQIIDYETVVVSDSFTLNVDAGALIEDIDITLYAAGIGEHGTCITTSPFIVWNTDVTHNPDTSDGPGNTDLYNLQITSTKLVGCMDGRCHYILTSNINFEPDAISYVGSGDSASIKVNVCIPKGTYAGRYAGTITVRDDDGYPLDTTDIEVTVLPSYDLDISDNEANLSANEMNLAGNPGTTVEAYFSLINPNTEELNVDPDPFGNADLTYLSYKTTDLVSGAFSIPDDSIKFPNADTTLKSGASASVVTMVSIPAHQHMGLYTGTVTVTDTEIVHGNAVVVTDSFTLSVEVGLEEDIDITTYAFGIGKHGTMITTSPVVVWNTDTENNPDTTDGPGNVDLYNLQIISTNLLGCMDQLCHYIFKDNISFTPDAISYVRSGDSASAVAHVFVPLGTCAGRYTGTVTIRDDDGYPLDMTDIEVTVLPSYDLDIADYGANLYGNTMNINGNVNDTVQAYFSIINPNTAELNVDPDPYGNANLTSLIYSVDTLRCDDFFIPTNHVSFPNAPNTLKSGGSNNVRLAVSIPAHQHIGLYTGTVTVTDTEVVNGNTIVVTDSFTIRVDVGVVEDLDVSPYTLGAGNHGTIITTSPFVVWNTDVASNPDTADGPGNTPLDNLQFTCTNLIDTLEHYILNKNISFEPGVIEYIESGDSAVVVAKVNVPLGTYANTYSGTILVKDDDGYPSDTLGITITVNPSYDLDISDNEGNLSGNAMSLSGDPGTAVDGYFSLINPNTAELNVDPDPFGNAALQNLTYESTALMTQSMIDTIEAGAVSFSNDPKMLGSGASALVTVNVKIPDGKYADTYLGKIRVRDADAGVADSFDIRLEVSALDGVGEALDIVESDPITGDGGAGDTLITIEKFTVQNTGKVDLDNVLFDCTNLKGPNNTVVLSDNVYFEPTSIGSLDIGATRTVTPFVFVEIGQHAGIYTGTIMAKDDDGWPFDTINIVLTITESFDLDIADNGLGLIGNTMHIAGLPGETQENEFLLINPNNNDLNVDPDQLGNADLRNLSYTSSDLTCGNYTILSSSVAFPGALDSLLSGSSANVRTSVIIPENQHAGIYSGTITVGNSQASDSFILKVEVMSKDSIAVPAMISASESAGNDTTVIFHVKNEGNSTLTAIELLPITDLISATGAKIPKSKVRLTPNLLDTLASGDSVEIKLRISIPPDIIEDLYTGELKTTDDDGTPFAISEIRLTVQSDILLTFSDNPVRGTKVDIGYRGDADADISLRIVNMAGEFVLDKKLNMPSYQSSDKFTWNLTNDKGKPVSSGVYICLLETWISGKSKVASRKLMIVR